MLGSTLFLILWLKYSCLAANDVPIIGILSQETYSVDKYFPGQKFHSYIAASYVKYLESAGARVTPVWIGREEEYYRSVIQHTNGLFLPGGATYFNNTAGYADSGEKLYKIAKEYNDKGDFYPVWGTCLGMELIMELETGRKDVRLNCSAKKIALPLEFYEGFNHSKMFKNASEDIIDILQTENVTYNYHTFCYTEDLLIQYDLLKNWTILSTNTDVNGLRFISALESKKYPFYGIQFHPEKNQFEFKRETNIPHSLNAVKISQYFANFFVEECRRNNHTFADWEIEQETLIYNYKTYFTGIQNSSYEQLYMFNRTDNGLS